MFIIDIILLLFCFWALIVPPNLAKIGYRFRRSCKLCVMAMYEGNSRIAVVSHAIYPPNIPVLVAKKTLLLILGEMPAVIITCTHLYLHLSEKS